MSRKKSGLTEQSIDETTEEISPIEEMDEVIEPLIKRVTIMAAKLSVVTILTTVVVLTAPVIGLAEQPLHQETPPVAEVVTENPAPGFLGQLKQKATNTAAAVKGNATSVWKGITNEDEKLARANALVKELTQQNADLKHKLTEKSVRAGVDHAMHLSCLRSATEYLGRIEPGD